MRKKPISSTEPNRFLTAWSVRTSALAWSKSRTVSTRCSTSLGPAMVPSFVTCATSISPEPREPGPFTSSWVQTLIWFTEPGSALTSRVYRVCSESTMIRTGFTCSSTCMMEVSSVSAEDLDARRRHPESFGAHAKLSRGFLPRDVQAPPGVTTRAASWSMSVDLPIPGSPPTRTDEPRMRPPPSTRFISAIPVSSRMPSRISMDDKRDRKGCLLLLLRPPGGSGRATSAARDLREAVPRAAFGASPEPSGLLVTAPRAFENGFCFRHLPARVGAAPTAVNRGRALRVVSPRAPYYDPRGYRRT